MHSYRPRFTLAGLREIMNFSKWMLATSILTFANRKADTFIIAKFLDAASLGVFALSRQISNMASAEIIAPIKQVLFPGYATLSHDLPLLRKAFLDAYAILVLVALPIAIGIGLTADLFVPILLGSKWLATIPLIQILVISGGVRSISSHARPVYLALNRPNLGAYASLGRIVVFLPLLVLGIHYYGLTGAALAHAATQVAVMFGSLYLMHRLLQLSFGQILVAGWRALAACALMAIGVELVKRHAAVADPGLLGQVGLLVAAAGAGLVIYVGCVLLLWRLCGSPTGSAESHILTYVTEALRKRRFLAARGVPTGNNG
jgi:O-antigen/teichoic acid export membrane protein